MKPIAVIRRLAYVLLVIPVAASLLPVPPAVRSAEQQTLEIASKSGVHVFAVELAVTDEERAKGLMFRRSLPESEGMLFDFKADQPISMWMRNTYVSLDMIFIQSDGRIRRIAENTETESDKIISSGGPVRAVLEVVAGTAKKFGIVARRSGGVSDAAPLNSGPRASRPLAALLKKSGRDARGPRAVAASGRTVYRSRNPSLAGYSAAW